MDIDNGLSSRYREIKERVVRAAGRSGRDPSSVTIIAVSKTQPVERIRDAAAIGIRDFGENRVQELLEKRALLSTAPPGAEIRWHMIGHLQTNKARAVVPHVVLIHSVDSIRLAEQIRLSAADAGRHVDVLLQINTSGEETKYGAAPGEARSIAESIAGAGGGIRLLGLMTLGPLTDDARAIRESFRLLRRSARDLKDMLPAEPILSMGMSGDFEIAIEEGSTHVRIGTALFGPRPT